MYVIILMLRPQVYGSTVDNGYGHDYFLSGGDIWYTFTFHGPDTLVVSGSKPAGEWEGPAIGPVLRHIKIYVQGGIDFACYPPMPSIFLLNLKGNREKRRKNFAVCLLYQFKLNFCSTPFVTRKIVFLLRLEIFS